MNSTTLDKPPCTYREETPVKECLGCGCWMRSKHDHADIFTRISEMTDVRDRQKAFEVLAELASSEELVGAET